MHAREPVRHAALGAGRVFVEEFSHSGPSLDLLLPAIEEHIPGASLLGGPLGRHPVASRIVHLLGRRPRVHGLAAQVDRAPPRA